MADCTLLTLSSWSCDTSLQQQESNQPCPKRKVKPESELRRWEKSEGWPEHHNKSSAVKREQPSEIRNCQAPACAASIFNFK
ncbi:uncharacterized [Tachysurus ichikawai]